MEHFLATGNLISRTNLDLMQTAGYTIVADKLNNHRYLSHFRSIHRGQYFAEMKTTTVRKLLPEAWGFLCPVHTPDGGPCGLLNHITNACVPLAKEESKSLHQANTNKNYQSFKELLASLGMHPVSTDFNLVYPYRYLPVMLDGVLMGYIDPKLAPEFVKSLRALKIQQLNTSTQYESVPPSLEVAYLPPTFVVDGEEEDASNPEQVQSSKKQGHKNKFFPGIFLASTIARFVRPVRNLEVGGTEWIGPLEQLNMSIACQEEDIRSDTTHQELDPINMLSMIASTQPFPEYN
jgi:DNA-directed RNA polymerase I subunit RPA2